MAEIFEPAAAKATDDTKATVKDSAIVSDVGAEEKEAAARKSNTAAAEYGKDIIDVVVDKKDEGIVELSARYRFEGEIIDSVDLSALENLTAEEARKIEKLYRSVAKRVSVSPEITPEYAMAAASYVTGIPVEFFEMLRLSDVTKLKTRVMNYIYGDSEDEEESENEDISGIIVLSKAYDNDGEKISEIDISELRNISAKQAQAIDKLYRKITKRISSLPETTLEYAIAAASYITGLPAKFFKKLKLTDMTAVRTHVINFIYPET